MKVLHVEAGRHLYGGALQVLYLVRGLRRRGIHNVLVCPPRSGIAAVAGEWVDGLVPMPMGGDHDLGLVWRLGRLLRRLRPDIVHLHSRRGADLMGGLAARWAGVPCVLTRRVDNPERAALVGLKYRLYGRVIAISRGIEQVLVGEGVGPDRLVCVPSAVDPDPYRGPCRRETLQLVPALPPGRPLLGVVAQLIERKGHGFLLEALPAVLRRHPRLLLLLFGKGPLQQALHGRIHELGLDDHVRLLGFRDDLPRWLPCLDLLVHPALMEGLGVSLLQAAAAGVPVVASRVGGIPEIVRDGCNGLLVPPADTAALSRAIVRILDHPEAARRMGARGRNLVEREFSIDAMVEGNLRVYRELLAPGGPAQRPS